MLDRNELMASSSGHSEGFIKRIFKFFAEHLAVLIIGRGLYFTQ